MTQREIRIILMIAREITASRSKFALFCIDLSRSLYGVIGANVREGEDVHELMARTPEVQLEYELFWREVDIVRRLE